MTNHQAVPVRSGVPFFTDIARLINTLVALLAGLCPTFLPEPLQRIGFTGFVINEVELLVPPLCKVPAGMFIMGGDQRQDPDANHHEFPQHQYYLADFFVTKYPITVAEYACAVRAGAVPEPSTPQGIPWELQLQQLDHPVVCVTWEHAVLYSIWLASMTGHQWRLPSEAEWEKSARWIEMDVCILGEISGIVREQIQAMPGPLLPNL